MSKELKSVQVLLSTYNGEKYIDEQLQSILNQDKATISVLIRDDGSTDRTIDILNDYALAYNNISVSLEKNVGAANSFLDLLDKSGSYDYYAFSDQDDVWDADKIYTAVENLEKEDNKPALYYSSTRIVNETLKPIYDTHNDELKSLCLQEVLLSNNATGCTMVINRALMDVLKQHHPTEVIMHDHWIYLVCVSVGGIIIVDQTPHINYRQHEANVIGKKMKFKTRLKYSSFGEKKGIRSRMAKEVLCNFNYMIPETNRNILTVFSNYKNGFGRKVDLIKCEIAYLHGLKRKSLFVAEVFLGLV